MLEGIYFNFSMQHIWHGGKVHPFTIPKYAEIIKDVFSQTFGYP
jgi:hypothetical protein